MIILLRSNLTQCWNSCLPIALYIIATNAPGPGTTVVATVMLAKPILNTATKHYDEVGTYEDELPDVIQLGFWFKNNYISIFMFCL